LKKKYEENNSNFLLWHTPRQYSYIEHFCSICREKGFFKFSTYLFGTAFKFNLFRGSVFVLFTFFSRQDICRKTEIMIKRNNIDRIIRGGKIETEKLQ